MSDQVAEAERQRRACYLHEAGHAVAAVHHGLVIRSVHCDGGSGYVDFGETQPVLDARAAFRKARDPGKTTLESMLDAALPLWEGEMVVRMAGLAGESLELGRALSSVRRGADDLATVFMMIAALLSGYPIAQRDPATTALFGRLSDAAFDTARSRQSAILSVADALRDAQTMTGAQVAELIKDL